MIGSYSEEEVECLVREYGSLTLLSKSFLVHRMVDVRRAYEALDGEEKLIFLLYGVNQMSLRDTADYLDISLGLVWLKWQRLIRKITRILNGVEP